MRLSETKIESGILHAEQYVRDAALTYFASSLSDNRTIMPVAMEAIKKYGWRQAFSEVESLQALAQSDPTISWLLDELGQNQESADQTTWDYLTTLSWVVAGADAGLLKRHLTEILDVGLLESDAKESIRERTRLLTASTDACWRELQEMCDRVGGGQSAPELRVDRAFHLIEAVSRQATKFSDRALAILSQEVDAAKDIAQAWMQVFMIRAAGQMRLHDAIPFIVQKLQQENADWVNEECVVALTRIGGDSVVKAVWNASALAGSRFNMYVTWVLESIHSDLAVEAALHLFERQEEISGKIEFGYALLSQFAIDGLMPVRHLIQTNTLDETMVDLRTSLMAVCTLMQAEIPELDGWREEFQQDQQERTSWQSPEFPVVDTWSSETLGQAAAQPAAEPLPLRIPQPRRQAVGRNEPCPCKSGKKYKNCCMRR